MTPRGRAALTALAIVAALVTARAGFARWLVADGIGASQRPLAAGPTVEPSARPRPPARGPLRVVVLDGLGREDAGLPALDRLCARGVDLAIDVGFPTKSLPVQAVLWTGLTARQLGLGPSNAARPTPPGALPAAVPGARAVVEAWGVIARSVGFATVEPAPAADWAAPEAVASEVAAWRGAFVERARAAVASAAPLVLVHVLGIDRAAHERGPGSAAHRAAIADADRALAGWLAAAPTASWLVLADHGHRAGGGHGDAEASVRIVRGCAWPRPPGADARGAVHLVDVAAHLREVAGVPPHPGAVGRRLAAAMAAPDPGATIGRPSRMALSLAAATLALALAGALRLAGRRRLVLVAPWLGLGVAVALTGPPSLSLRAPMAVALAGLASVGLALAWTRGDRASRRAIALLIVGSIGAAAWVAELPQALVTGTPAARPFSTAWFELVAGVGAGGLLAVAAAGVLSPGTAGALSAHPDRPGRARRPASGRS